MKTTKNWRRVLSLLFAFVMTLSIMVAGAIVASAQEAAPVSDNVSVARVDAQEYASLKEAVEAAALVEGGAVVELLGDVVVGEKITVNGNVTISGEYTVYRQDNYTGTLFTVSAGATLTLNGVTVDGANNYVFDKDAFMADVDNWNVPVAQEDSAKWFTPEEGAPVASAFMFTTTGGTINLNNVTVQNNYSVNSGVISVGAGSTVTLAKVKVTHVAATQGNGLIVSASGADINVTVNDGTLIDGNHAGGNHGLFKVYSGATLTINDGAITNNTGWNSNGLAVGVYWGTFYLNGGLIDSNVSVYGPANGRNAAIYLHSGHTFVMNGGTVSANSGRARGGIDAPYENGTAVINDGVIIGNVSRANSSTYDVLGTTGMTIKGGIYSQDVSEWLAEGLMLVDLRNGTYAVTNDPYYNMVARIGNEYFETFMDAYNAASDGDTIVMLKTGVISTNSDLRLGKDITIEAEDVNPALRIQGNGKVHFWNTTIKNQNGYAMIIGDTEGKTAPTVHIHGGYYEGRTSVISVTSGVLYVDKEGGEFKLVDPDEYGYVYLINCIDANYPRRADVIIYGGTFHNWNPANNAAEGKGTNFCANGYTPRETAPGSNVWTVHVYKKTVVRPTCENGGYTVYTCERCNDSYVTSEIPAVGHSYDAEITAPAIDSEGYTTYTCGVCGDSYVDSYVPALVAVAEVDGVKYLSLKEAIEACKNGETVKLLTDIVYTDADVSNAIGAATGFGAYYNPTVIAIGGTEGATPEENKPSEVNAVVDLNGYSIINNASAYLFIIVDNAKITFKDSVGTGKIDTNVEAPAIWVIGSETLVTIESGYYETDSATGLLHSTHAGDLVIKGGVFKTTADDASLLVVINSKSFKNPNYFLVGVASVSIEGGLFYGFNPMLVGDDNGAKSIADIKYFNGCADGFCAVKVGEDAWQVIRQLDFRGARLLLGDGIGIYFLLNTEQLIEGKDYIAVFTYLDGEGNTVKLSVPSSEWKHFDDKVTTGILFDTVDAASMSTLVTIVIMADGNIASETQSTSVQRYAEAIIDGEGYSPEAKILAKSLLDYGAYAQNSIAKASGALVNANVNPKNIIADVDVENKLVAGDEFYGSSMNLNSYLDFNFKFFKDELVGATHAVITYNGKEVIVYADMFGEDEKKGQELVVVTLVGLITSDAIHDLTCTVYGDDVVLATVTDSVYSYCARALTGLGKLDAETLAKQSYQPEFYKAFVLYIEAAAVYTKSLES